jgi:hypothetical protein
MKSKDQQLLEEAYLKTNETNNVPEQNEGESTEAVKRGLIECASHLIGLADMGEYFKTEEIGAGKSDEYGEVELARVMIEAANNWLRKTI